jgi:hypothetical protein
MERKRRILLSLAGALAAAALSAGPAAASHGGGSSTTPAPPPAESVDVCAGPLATVSYTDGSSAVINPTAAGCVVVRHYPSGVNVLDFVDLLPGWTYSIVSNGAGTSSRVQLSFSNLATGQKASIRVENGKTVIG